MSPPYQVRQLAELCALHPLTSKILFVPAMPAGYDLTTALVRCGHRWTNLRVTTPVLLAVEQLQPRMAVLGVRQLHTEGRRRLIESLLDSWSPANRRYFLGGSNPSAADAGLAGPLERTFDAMRQARVLPEHMGRISGGDDRRSAKAADLSRLYADYIQQLQQGNWWDDADLLTEAAVMEHAPKGIVWAILDETELSPLAAEYVNRLTGGDLSRLGRRTYGVEPPPSNAAVRFAASRIPGETVTAAAVPADSPRRSPDGARRNTHRPIGLVQGDLFLDPLRDADPEDPLQDLYAFSGTRTSSADVVDVAPGGRLLTTGLTPADTDKVRLRLVIGLETEVRQVLRDVLRRGLAFDDVEIAYTTTTPYQALLYDAVERWDLPADFAAGVPTSLTRPGRALVAFLGWIATDLQGVILARHLQAREIGWTDDQVQPTAVARWLLQGRAGAGRKDTLAALDRLAISHDSDAGSRARLAAGRAQLQILFDRIPDGDSAEGLLTAAVAYLKSLPLSGADERATRDRRIRDQLMGHLNDLSDFPAGAAPRAVQARRLLEVVRRHSCGASHSRPGYLRVGPLREAGYSGRQHLYILGLDESRFPGSLGQDPILLDEERRSLSTLLPLQATNARDEIFQLIRVLGSAAGAVTLVASRLHLADGREPHPTPLFEQACRQLQQQPEVSGPVPTGADGPDGRADDLDTQLEQRLHPGLANELAGIYPDVARGMLSALARTHAAPSRFSGWIAHPADESLDLTGQRVLSSRMLETLAECPRRYLMRYGLGLTPPDTPRPDPRRWLQPLEMGNLLHGLFVDFMQQLRGTRPEVSHEQRLQDMVEAAIAAERQRVPVTLKAAYRNDCRRIERAARIFLHAEAQRLAADPALHPAAFELDFGFDEAIEIRLSHDVAFRLRGRIDRVDAVHDASGTTVAYEIWDYKTGTAFPYDITELVQGGRTLQWALYAYALPQLLADDGDVRLSGYFFASDRGSGQRFSDAPPPRHELAAILQPLFDMSRQGFFPALHKGDGKGGGPCRFCDYHRICAAEARGADDVDELFSAATELAALVDGWADTVSARRSGSRQTLETAFAALGLEPGDVAPEDAARSARDWIGT